MQAFFIDASSESYESAAQLLTVVVWPDLARPDTTFDQRYGATCAYLLRQRAERDPAWLEEHQSIRPMHALIHPDEVAAAKRVLEAELPKRLAAGEFAIPFLDRQMNPTAPLPTGVKRLTQNAVAGRLAEITGGSTGGNFMTYTVRPSYRVLHLCAVLALLARGYRTAGFGPTLWEAMADGSITTQAVVKLAQDLEALVGACPKLRVTEDELIKVRWSELGFASPPAANQLAP